MNAKQRHVRTLAMAACMMAALIAPACNTQAAPEVQQAAVNRADRFLKTEDIGKTTLNFVHFGADYHGHQYLNTVALGDGAFKLVYRFHWEDDGITDVGYLCDSRGNIYGVQIGDSNAVVNQPFLLANGAIKLLGNALIELYKDQLTTNQRSVVQDLVDKADAHGLLEWSLKFQQATQN